MGPWGAPIIQTKQIKLPSAILVAAEQKRGLKTAKLMLAKTDYKPVMLAPTRVLSQRKLTLQTELKDDTCASER